MFLYKEYQFNEERLAGSAEALTRYLSNLGNPANLDCTYKPNSTSTYNYKIPIFFRNCGLQCSDYVAPDTYFYMDYWRNRPQLLLMTGALKDGRGHAWVNTGYAEINENSYIKSYLFMNWGWGTKANGWYLASTEFDTGSSGGTSGVQYQEKNYPPWVSNENSYLFNRYIRVLEVD